MRWSRLYTSSAEVPRVPQGIAAGLRINAHTMWSFAHFDACEQTSSRGVDSIDFVMIAPSQP